MHQGVSVDAHCGTKKHSEIVHLRKNNQVLPGTTSQSTTQSTCSSSATCGIEPSLLHQGLVREEGQENSQNEVAGITGREGQTEDKRI